MEKNINNKIILNYNNKKIELELSSSYKEFLDLLENKLYLNKYIMDNIRLKYYDKDNDLNYVTNEDEYNTSLNEHNGNWEMNIELFDNLENIKKEHDSEVLRMKNQFEKMLNLISDNYQKKLNELELYYENRMKDNFQKYNQIIISNIQKGISESGVNYIYNQFIQNINKDN